MPRRAADDFDNLWKKFLQRYLRAFLSYLFPAIEGDVDWCRGYESLDREFQRIARRAKVGKQLADKLFESGSSTARKVCSCFM